MRQVFFREPDGTVLTKTASLINAGTDGRMKYVGVAGNADQDGEWFVER